MKVSVLIIILMLFFIRGHSQENLKSINVSSYIESICQNKKGALHLAHSYFFKKKWDSAYYYSNRIDDKLVHKLDVKNYINGVSAYHKKFFSIAENKLKSIPETFQFNYLVWNKLGAIALEKKEIDKALRYFTLVINSNNKTTEIESKALHDLGSCYLILEKYKKAEDAFNSALKIAHKGKDTIQIIYNTLDLGNTYYNQYLDKKAIPLFEKSYTLSRDFSDLKLKRITTFNLAIVEKNQQNFKKSIDYFLESDRWKDSIWNRDKISLLLEKDKQFAVSIKNKEIFIQKEISKHQEERILLFTIAFIISLLFLSVLLYLYRIKTKQNTLINKQKKELEKLNKTKNYLFSVISHDLRSPINTLIHQQDKIKTHLANNDLLKAKHATNSVITLSKNVKQLLNNVLHWSLEQNNQLLFKTEIFAVQPIIKQVLADFIPLAQARHILLKFQIDNTIFINADRESLKIILRNILDNAIKYTPEYGSIKISTQIVSNNKCAITVEDTGVGFSEELLQRINVLQDLNIDKIDRSKGVGLGLLLCTTLIKKNNGTLAIESLLHKGTSMVIQFPLTHNN